MLKINELTFFNGGGRNHIFFTIFAAASILDDQHQSAWWNLLCHTTAVEDNCTTQASHST